MKKLVLPSKFSKYGSALTYIIFGMTMAMLLFALLAGTPAIQYIASDGRVLTASEALESGVMPQLVYDTALNPFNAFSSGAVVVYAVGGLLIAALLFSRKNVAIYASAGIAVAAATLTGGLITQAPCYGELTALYTVIPASTAFITAILCLLTGLGVIKIKKPLSVFGILSGATYLAISVFDLFAHVASFLTALLNNISEINELGLFDAVSLAKEVLGGGGLSKYLVGVSFHAETLLLITYIPLALMMFSYIPVAKALAYKGTLEAQGINSLAAKIGVDDCLFDTKSVGAGLIVSVLTFGLYTAFWQYSFIKKIRVLDKKSPKGGILTALAFVFVPFFNCFWSAKSAGIIHRSAAEMGVAVNDNSMFYIILSLLKLDVIVCAIIQSNLNMIAKQLTARAKAAGGREGTLADMVDSASGNGGAYIVKHDDVKTENDKWTKM